VTSHDEKRVHWHVAHDTLRAPDVQYRVHSLDIHPWRDHASEASCGSSGGRCWQSHQDPPRHSSCWSALHFSQITFSIFLPFLRNMTRLPMSNPCQNSRPDMLGASFDHAVTGYWTKHDLSEIASMGGCKCLTR
jgi:hypothetical protein